MASVSSILRASLTGSVEFLVLNGAGAVIAHLGHWSDTLGANLSSSVFKVLLPSLVFGPVLRTSSSLSNTLFSSSTTSTTASSFLQSIAIPFFYSIFVLVLTSALFHPFVRIVGRNKHPFVRALMWCCLVLGNTTTLPVVILEALCNSLPMLDGHATQCTSAVTAYSAIFLIPQIVFTWAVAFPCLQTAANADHDDNDDDVVIVSEKDPLLPTVINYSKDLNDNKPININLKKHTSKLSPSFFSSFLSKLMNPPVITVFLAALLGMCPIIPELFVKPQGPFNSILTALDTLGALAVSLSAVIVGAETYNGLRPSSSTTTTAGLFSTKAYLRFGTVGIIGVTVMRMVILPWLGRFMYSSFNVKAMFRGNDVLGLFVLQQTNLTTASSILIIVSMLQKHSPFINVLKRDVAAILLLQFVIAPVFLTLNTGLSIAIQFS